MLPLDVLETILNLLELKDKISLLSTCHQFYDMTIPNSKIKRIDELNKFYLDELKDFREFLGAEAKYLIINLFDTYCLLDNEDELENTANLISISCSHHNGSKIRLTKVPFTVNSNSIIFDLPNLFCTRIKVKYLIYNDEDYGEKTFDLLANVHNELND